MSRAMIYATFSELLKVFQCTCLVFCKYIQYDFSRLIEHRYERPGI